MFRTKGACPLFPGIPQGHLAHDEVHHPPGDDDELDHALAGQQCGDVRVVDGPLPDVLRRLFVEPAVSIEAAVQESLAQYGPRVTIAVTPKGPYILADLAKCRPFEPSASSDANGPNHWPKAGGLSFRPVSVGERAERGPFAFRSPLHPVDGMVTALCGKELRRPVALPRLDVRSLACGPALSVFRGFPTVRRHPPQPLSHSKIFGPNSRRPGLLSSGLTTRLFPLTESNPTELRVARLANYRQRDRICFEELLSRLFLPQ